MFQKLKKLFTKNSKSVNQNHITNDTLNFKDLALQDIEITIQPDGNSSALIFRELKNNYNYGNASSCGKLGITIQEALRSF